MPILSAVQFRPRLARSEADVADNIRQCDDLIHQAWNMGSELIVFPELFATGYSFMSKEEAARACEPFNGPTFRTMSGIARELESFVSWGYMESDGEYLYNSATLVGPHGELISRYRKINLWGNDFLWARPGSEPAPVVHTDIGDISIIVCRDVRDKVPGNIPAYDSGDIRRDKLFDKVDIVAASMNWGKGGFPPTQWMDFVANNNCTLVAANRWGDEVNGTFTQDFGHGGSMVIESDWTCHTQGLQFGQNCVVTARIEAPNE